MKTPAIICDLDGTIALMEGRGPFEWDKVATDKPNPPVIDLLRRYEHDHAIVIVSGRSDECSETTALWLEEYTVPCQYLLMRKAGDYRPDSIVKAEIYNDYIADVYEVAFCLDDRNQSVEFWRSLGLVCFQVAPGNF